MRRVSVSIYSKPPMLTLTHPQPAEPRTGSRPTSKALSHHHHQGRRLPALDGGDCSIDDIRLQQCHRRAASVKRRIYKTWSWAYRAYQMHHHRLELMHLKREMRSLRISSDAKWKVVRLLWSKSKLVSSWKEAAAVKSTMTWAIPVKTKALFSSQKNLQNFSHSLSHRIFRRMHWVLNIDENKN